MNFIIYGLPRSRTAWLSAFLSYKDWTCYHEQAIFMRSMDDVKSLFQPKTGTVETAAAQGRCLLQYYVPNLKEVVILRPVEDVVNSMMRLDVSSVAIYDRNKLTKMIEYGDRALRKIIRDKNVLVVDYDDLCDEKVCAGIFEYCLEYGFDKQWWDSFKNKNVQTSVPAFLRYYQRHKEEIEEFKKHCKSEMRKLYKAGELKKVA